MSGVDAVIVVDVILADIWTDFVVFAQQVRATVGGVHNGTLFVFVRP